MSDDAVLCETDGAVAIVTLNRPAALNAVTLPMEDLALMCDIRIASTEARFSQAYVRMGLVADVPGFWMLPELVGRSTAAQLLLTGETVDAAAAFPERRPGRYRGR